MEIFKKIKNSVYGPDYYGQAEKKPFSYSLKYYLLFVLIISFLATIVVSVKTVPQIKSFADYFLGSVINRYPAELEVTIKSGKVSTNVQEPYFVGMPKKWEGAGYENILVIDTKNSFTEESFVGYKTACLLNETSIICYDKKDIKITSLKDVPDTTINKDKIISLAGKFTPFLRLIYPAFIILVFCVIFFSYSWRLAYLLIFAILVWIIAKLKKVDMGYKKSYQLGLHLLTMPVIVTFLLEAVLKLTGTSFNIPYLFSILFAISSIINLKRHDQIMVVPQAPGNVPDKL
jgi:hypothetical protein